MPDFYYDQLEMTSYKLFQKPYPADGSNTLKSFM